MSAITEQKPLVPELRFSEFNSLYSSNSLKELTSSVDYRGKAPIKSDSGVFLVTAKNIKKGKIDYDCSKEYVPRDLYDEVMRKGKPKIGDVLFTTEAPLGNVAQVNNANIALAQRVIKFRGKELLSNAFLKNYFLSTEFTKRVHRISIGSTVQGVSGKDLHKVTINFPELNEQQKIADFLESVDAWLDHLRGQKTALQSYKQGMMQKLFTGQVRFKDENGRNFPEWQEVSMSDIGDSFGGLSGKSGDDFGQGESFITYKQIFDDSVIEPKKFAKVTVAPGEKQNRAQKGDVFFTVSSETPNEVGYASVLMEDVNPYLNSFAFGFRPKSLTDLLPEYSRYHFRSAPFRRQVVRLAQGSTRYNISKVQFMKLIIEIPSASEQQKIADFLTALDQTITAKADEITKVEEWKKGLMQKMFV